MTSIPNENDFCFESCEVYSRLHDVRGLNLVDPGDWVCVIVLGVWLCLLHFERLLLELDSLVQHEGRGSRARCIDHTI